MKSQGPVELGLQTSGSLLPEVAETATPLLPEKEDITQLT